MCGRVVLAGSVERVLWIKFIEAETVFDERVAEDGRQMEPKSIYAKLLFPIGKRIDDQIAGDRMGGISIPVHPGAVEIVFVLAAQFVIGGIV